MPQRAPSRYAQRMDEIRVASLDVGRLDDWRRLFAAGKATGAWWYHCHCAIWHHTGGMDVWDAQSGEEHRDAMSERVRAGRYHGLLAYAGDDVVGWCRAGPRSELGFTMTKEPAGDDAERLGIVSCFVVHPAWRGRGVARALVRGLDDHFRALGCTMGEAHPLVPGTGEFDGMQGYLAWFVAAGWQDVRASGEHARVVRKSLMDRDGANP